MAEELSIISSDLLTDVSKMHDVFVFGGRQVDSP